MKNIRLSLSENYQVLEVTLSIYLNRRVFVMVCQPAHGKPYKEPTITVEGQRLQAVAKFTTLEAHCLELCTLMMKSLPRLSKLEQHLADYEEVFGIEVESDLTQS